MEVILSQASAGIGQPMKLLVQNMNLQYDEPVSNVEREAS